MAISLNDLKKYFDIYVKYCEETKLFNDRKPNIPSGLTEGLALFALNSCEQKYKSAEVGDIISIHGNYRVEVKASSVGFDRKDCSSFGPNEKFDNLIFVDCDTNKKEIIVYDCHISYDKMQELQITKKQTFGDQCKEKRRPRFSIKEKLSAQMTVVQRYNFT